LFLDLAFKASQADSDAMLMLKSFEVHGLPGMTVAELRAKLASTFNLPLEDLTVMVRIESSNRLLTDDSRALNYYGIGRYSEVNPFLLLIHYLQIRT